MGKRGGKKSGRNGRGGGNPNRRQFRVDYETIVRENDQYEQYYKELGIVPENEWGEFWAALRRDLPNSFRFTGSKGHALAVQKRLKEHYIPEISSILFEGESVQPPTQLQWYPNGLAWQMTTPKKVVRKFPPFASFQKFLVSETTVGNITRQEVVSMIPPLLLDVRPGMTVLDLCAAPGSKSAQLLEMVHGGEEARVREVSRRLKRQEGREISPDGEDLEQDLAEETKDSSSGDWSDDGRSTGILVANDVDHRRAHMLIHQMKRLSSPNLIITNHDAQHFPSIRLPSSQPPSDTESSFGKYLKFDRILADVPCSGDGTARKNPNVWKDWNPGNGIGLHVMQVRILVRALQMLKVGGKAVYSTCSMNPIENEAVVASAIDRCGGTDKVELLDCSRSLPQLLRRPGLKTWKVIDKQRKSWSSWEDVQEEREQGHQPGLEKLTKSMFPSSGYDELHLERCMRVYAHMQDTGSFFIVLLKKNSEIKARPAAEPKKSQEEEQQQKILQTGSDLLATRETSIDKTKNEAVEIKSEAVDTVNEKASVTVTDEVLQIPGAEQSVSSNAEKDNQTPIRAQSPREKHDLSDEALLTPSKRVKLEEDLPKVHGATEEIKPARDFSDNFASIAAKKRGPTQFEEPFKYLDEKHEVLGTICEFYEIQQRFPRDRFMVRNAGGIPSKTIYYTSSLARDILTANEGKGIKFVHCGVKMFVKQDVQRPSVLPWRIQTDGVPLVEPWTGTSRAIRMHSRRIFKTLLVEMFPKVGGDSWKELGEIGERVRDMDMGCYILRVGKGEGDDAFSERIVLPLWRSLHSLNLMLPKEDRKAMLLRLYNEDLPIINYSQERSKGMANSAREQLDAEEKPADGEEENFEDATEKNGLGNDSEGEHPMDPLEGLMDVQ